MAWHWKPPIGENKSWNINTVNSVYTNLHVSPLNKYVKTKILPVARFRFRKCILLYIFQKNFKTFHGCFIVWYAMCTITLLLDDKNFVNFAKWTGKLRFDSFLVEWTLTQRVISGFFWLVHSTLIIWQISQAGFLSLAHHDPTLLDPEHLWRPLHMSPDDRAGSVTEMK